MQIDFEGIIKLDCPKLGNT